MDEDNEAEEDEEFVFDDEYLTWGAVSKATGVEEDTYQTRLSKGKNMIQTSATTKIVEKGSTSKTRVPTTVLLREDDVEDEDEEADEYHEGEEDYTDSASSDEDIGLEEDW